MADEKLEGTRDSKQGQTLSFKHEQNANINILFKGTKSVQNWKDFTKSFFPKHESLFQWVVRVATNLLFCASLVSNGQTLDKIFCKKAPMVQIRHMPTNE